MRRIAPRHATVAGGQAGPALQMLMFHAARDFRAIGHKTIAAANPDRLYRALGADRLLAEPLVRSLTLAVQNRRDDAAPAGHRHLVDHDWKVNRLIAANLPPDWSEGREDVSAARTLLEQFRTASSGQAVAASVDLLKDGISADTVWEAITMFAAEMILEQFLDNRRRERFLARLTRAATVIDADETATLVEEALPFDNEALELTEGGSPAIEVADGPADQPGPPRCRASAGSHSRPRGIAGGLPGHRRPTPHSRPRATRQRSLDGTLRQRDDGCRTQPARRAGR